MFVGREFELGLLNDLYGKDGFQAISITGRRHIGKTRLVEEFVRGRKAIIFKAVPGNGSINLSRFNEAVSGDTEPLKLGSILQKTEEMSGGERLIVVIDGYPALEEGCRHVRETISGFIESAKETSELFLILCGASVNPMGSETMGKNESPYDGLTGHIHLQPFDFETSRKMLCGFSITDAVAIYGLVGGIPYYLEQFEPEKSLEENVRDHYLDPSSMVAREPEIMFLTEFRKPASYYSVIYAISKGAVTPSEIGQMLGMKVDLVSHMLAKMDLLGFVGKDEPFGKGKTRDIRYVIEDRLLASYFRFVYPFHTGMSVHETDAAWEYMGAGLGRYLGHVFGDICREYVLKRGYSNAGKWWSGSETIDLVASDGSSVLLAECIYGDEPVDADAIEGLLEKSKAVGTKLTKKHALFSKSGYTEVAEIRAKADGVGLVRLSDMFQ